MSGQPARVCFDARWANDAGGTGVATFGETLARALPIAGLAAERLVDGGIRWSRARRWASALSLAPVQARRIEGGDWAAADIYRRAQNRFSASGRPLEIAFDPPPAIMHWTYPLPLWAAGAVNIYTIHDLIPLDQPELTGIDRKRHMRLLRAVTAHADHVLTVSETSRAAIIERLGIAPDRVTSLYQPGGALPARSRGDAEFPDQGYYLHVGRIEPRKNLERLIEAHRRSGSARPLLIVGPDGEGPRGWSVERVLRHVDGERVVRLGWVDRERLSGLIGGCRALLLPSLAEGFGLPIVEAMTAGAAVMTSDFGATAEIAGEAALLVDPWDVAAMADAIRRIDGDDALVAWLRYAGRRRAGQFSVEAFAAGLSMLYRKLLA